MKTSNNAPMMYYTPVHGQAFNNGDREFSTGYPADHPTGLSMLTGVDLKDRINSAYMCTCPLFTCLGSLCTFGGVIALLTIANRQSKTVTNLVVKAVTQLSDSENLTTGLQDVTEQVENLDLRVGNNSFPSAFAAALVAVFGGILVAFGTKAFFQNIESKGVRIALALVGIVATLFAVIQLADQKRFVGGIPVWKYPQSYAIPLVFWGVMMAFGAVAVKNKGEKK